MSPVKSVYMTCNYIMRSGSWLMTSSSHLTNLSIRYAHTADCRQSVLLPLSDISIDWPRNFCRAASRTRTVRTTDNTNTADHTRSNTRIWPPTWKNGPLWFWTITRKQPKLSDLILPGSEQSTEEPIHEDSNHSTRDCELLLVWCALEVL